MTWAEPIGKCESKESLLGCPSWKDLLWEIARWPLNCGLECEWKLCRWDVRACFRYLKGAYGLVSWAGGRDSGLTTAETVAYN